ncbi:MAG: polysaccharide deacetylase family protein [Bacilli bacterium]
MKQFFSMLGVITLVCFSFYYTNQVAKIVRGNDPLMKEILKAKTSYEVQAVNASINNETIIPGLNGKTVNLDRSYSNMKRLGKFSKDLLVFNEVIPDISLTKKYDKYIVKGNKEIDAIALVFPANSIDYVEDILNILTDKDVSATFFIDGVWAENNLTLIENLAKNGNEIENFGYDGTYSKDRLIWTSNMLEAITKEEPKYCYTKYRDDSLLDLCKSYHMYTVRPTIITGSYPFLTVKRSITKGAIVNMELNTTTVKELGAIISYIKQKGYQLVTLKSILSENLIIEK